MKNKSLKKLIIIIFIAIVLFVVYSYFFKKEKNIRNFGSLSSEMGNSTILIMDEADIDNEIVTLLNNINSIEINDEILYHPAFDTLRDFTLNIQIPRIVGRINPFAPMGYNSFINEEKEAEILGEEFLDIPEKSFDF